MTYNKYFVRVHFDNEPDLFKHVWDNTLYSRRIESSIIGPHAETAMHLIHMTEEEAVVLKLTVPIIGNIVFCSQEVV